MNPYAPIVPKDTQSQNPADTCEPDRNLKTWEKWVSERKKVTKKLTSVTQRQPVNLLINTGDKVREMKERKTVLECAQLKEKPELRGGPWEQPLRLHQECPCKAVYEVKRTTIEKGEVPPMEYIGVPEYIQKEEKGVVGKANRKPCKETGFDQSKYKAYREKQFHEEIQRIEPHRPSLSKLIIKGSRPKTPPKKPPTVPTISISEDLTSCNKEILNVNALRINNTVFIKEFPKQCLDYLRSLREEEWHQNLTSWTYYFNAPTFKITRNKFVLTNLGTVALRYCWYSIKPMCPALPGTLKEPVFFFNKNEDVLSPGETREINFIFVSKLPGIFEEVWHFHISNVHFEEAKVNKLKVILSGDAFEPDLPKKRNEIQRLHNYINDRARHFAIRSILSELVAKSVVITPESYPYKNMFLEESIFLIKNPVCFYHQTELEKLKKMYKGLVQNAGDNAWDLSIRTLRNEIVKQPFDDRMQYYEMLKNSHDILLKPWEEGDSLSKQKHRAMKQVLCQFVDQFEYEKQRLRMAFNQSIQKVSMDVSTYAKAKEISRELFIIVIKEHFAETIEKGAAMLSSLDLYRWIDFQW